MEQNVNSSESFLWEWRNLTSQHIKQFWLGFGNIAPLYVGRVKTMFYGEVRLQRDSFEDMVPGYNGTIASITRPEPLQITYTQEILYVALPGREDPYITTTDIFTIPFEQDAKTYTENLRAISNNSQIIFMEYTGVVTDPTTPEPPSPHKDQNIIIIVVTVVAFSLIVASAYIIYLTRMKEHDHRLAPLGGDGACSDGEPPIVGAIIGVNTNDNILISESYDDDFLENSFHLDASSTAPPLPSSADVQQPALEQSENLNGDGDHLNLLSPVDDTDATELDSSDGSTRGERFPTEGGETFPTISTVPLTVSDLEGGGENADNYFNYSPMQSFRSSSMGSQNDQLNYSPPSPLMLGLQGEEYVKDASGEARNGNGDDDDDDDDHSSEEPQIPFMSGFQLEIQDLE